MPFLIYHKPKKQAPVVQKLDNAIRWINHSPADNLIIMVYPTRISWIVIYPVDSAIQLLNDQGQDFKTLFLRSQKKGKKVKLY